MSSTTTIAATTPTVIQFQGACIKIEDSPQKTAKNVVQAAQFLAPKIRENATNIAAKEIFDAICNAQGKPEKPELFQEIATQLKTVSRSKATVATQSSESGVDIAIFSTLASQAKLQKAKGTSQSTSSQSATASTQTDATEKTDQHAQDLVEQIKKLQLENDSLEKSNNLKQSEIQELKDENTHLKTLSSRVATFAVNVFQSVRSLIFGLFIKRSSLPETIEETGPIIAKASESTACSLGLQFKTKPKTEMSARIEEIALGSTAKSQLQETYEMFQVVLKLISQFNLKKIKCEPFIKGLTAAKNQIELKITALKSTFKPEGLIVKRSENALQAIINTINVIQDNESHSEEVLKAQVQTLKNAVALLPKNDFENAGALAVLQFAHKGLKDKEFFVEKMMSTTCD